MDVKDMVVVLDCGSQYTQLIARRVRELEVYSEILPWDAEPEEVLSRSPKGIIVSGGPRSCVEEGAPKLSERLLKSGIPILGICYGMQMLAHQLGGRVVKAPSAEYGRCKVQVDSPGGLLRGFPEEFTVWMSHWDQVEQVPPGARVLARSESGAVAAFETEGGRISALQFHPEVAHTEKGTLALANFLFGVCGCERTWVLTDWVDRMVESIRTQVGDDRVICGLSGGVDSTVAAVLTSKAIGDRLSCIFVDNGLLRKDEARKVMETYTKLDLNVKMVDASDRFLEALKGVEEPEAKRKTIGEVFVRVFEEESSQVEGARWLLQGTLYPDVIESGHQGKGAAVIKSHHNVGGLPDFMKLKVLEPLRDLFKDEVRRIGAILGVPEGFLKRHPFPGPGLAVRCLGEVARERLDVLREADHILQEEIANFGLYDSLWQCFCVLLPVRSVGVMGDVRTYAETAVIRAVESQDGMTADWARLPYELLDRVSRRICNQVRGINRVVLDVTGKPPATIEWE
ncbi:GMP synthase (glutamine-hydrolyzing) [Thermanaerovibrio velox DSM 12556]|uniref:GMP synthase [glutamine-hydrolyzing] n=1 Tax=Thermanaerovibrio velox DSM 12556 TaxID=926567 RepID=H0UQE2_9BACT|nr:glutamine-hydrolyzing GMP synthase [Thermanaerovibrio velox]EHM09696.1 GMP synthase (glutamine-hydrolyzing) [Thermanaerovibrio velox DSM 12556]